MAIYNFDEDLDFIKGSKSEKAANKPKYDFDADLDFIKGEKKQKAATVTSIASSFNPDEIAQLRYLGKQTGIPDAIAERNPAEIKRKALSLKVESIYDNSPVLARKLSDPAFAKINHDIVDENSKIELSIKNLSLAAKPMRAAGNLVTDTNITNQLNPKVAPSRSLTEMMTDPLKSFAGGSNTMLAGFAELSRYSPQEIVLQRALNAIAPSFAQARSEITDNAQQALNQGQEYWQQQKSDQVKEKLKAFNSAPIGESIAMLISNPDLLVDQLSQSMPYLVPGAGAARIGTGATAAYMTLSEAMDSANTARQEAIASGASQDEQDKAAATAALVTAPLVFLGNKLVGADKLEQLFLSSGKVNVGLISAMVREAVSGSIEEGANQLGVNVGASNTFDPVRDLTQGVGKAMAIGGILESTQGAAMAGINYAAQAMGKVQNDSVQAESTMQAFANIQQLAEQSKLKQRSAQDFATFLQEAGGENGLDEVYIDARTFVEEAEKQGVDLNTLMQSSPVINQQLQEAIAQGVDLVIPVGEFGASIAGTEFGGAILQHLRADENGISAFEAQTQLDGAVEELQRQAEQVAQQYQDNEAWTQSIAEVSDNLLGQLNAVGRFTPQNNQAYVNGLVAPWYSTLASNLGITPAEAYARYPLQVSGNVTADGFEQNDIVGKNEALSSLSKLSQVVYDETYTPQDAYDALYEAANPKQKTVLRALSKEQMLGFEYPHQALDELRRNPEAYQTSPAFKGILTKAGNNQFNQAEQIKPEIKNLIDIAESKSNENVTVTIGDVASWEVSEAKEQANIDIKGYKHTVDMYAVRHTLNRHGDEKIEASRGQLPITESDIEQIPSAVLSPDAVVYGIKNERKQDVIASIQMMQDGSLLVIEEVRIGKKTLALASARKFPPAKDYDSIARTLLSNAQSDKGDKLSIVNHSSNVNNGNNFNQQARGQISFSNDITQGANITLLKNADASTFIHELGHFFLEVYADVASKPDAPQVIVDDMNQLFNWFGIESTEQPAIDVWRNMNIEQKRFYHEKLARGFEQYAMEGTAPTLELSRVFAKLRSFMLSAYKSLKQFFERSGEPGLTPEVRQVFDRMLASEDAINKAQAVRGMMPMFASMEEAGMSVDEYAEYLQNQQDATDEAKAQLTARSLRDMKWLQGARSRVLRDLQRQADAERRTVRMAVRREVMTQPVYQAYSWLKQIPDESKAQQAEKVKATKGVDVEKDSLYTAIAKLGGLNRELAASEWGIDPKDKFDSGVFGKPVLRKEGGLSPDAMAEALAQYEYLTLDENGKWDLREFEDKFFEEAKGERQYSLFAEGEQYRKWQESIYDEQERVRLDAFGKGKLDLNSMKAVYGEEGAWRNLGVGRTGMVMAVGNAPDAVAELFGFGSGDHLIQSLLAAEKPSDLIERMTNERMLAEFGDLVDAKKMNEAADKAVHNELRARVLATELSAQNKALGNRRILDAAAKEYAQQRIAQKQVKDIKPYVYVRAEEKAAKIADKATKQGDMQTAVQAKRDVLLNNRTAKEAFAAVDEIERYINKVRKLNKSSVQNNMRGEPLVQMLAVLERFDFRTGVSNAQLAEMRGKEQLAQWVEKEAERLVAVVPDLPDFVLDENYRKSYKDMTLAELRELMGAITQLEQLARRENKQYKEIRNQTFQEEKATILEQIKTTYPQLFDAEGKVKPDVPSLVVKLEDKLADSKDGMLAGYLNITSMAEILDGGKTAGVVFESLFGRYSEASNYKSNRLSEIYSELKPYLKDQYSLAERRAFSRKDIGTATVGIPLTRENAVVAVALYGSEEGRQRLSNWFDAGQMQQVIDLLDQRDIELVKTLWRVSDEMIWPELEAVNNRTKGISPPKVKGAAFDTKFGTLEGGYFHLDYRSADNPEKGVQVQTFDASKSLDELRAGIGMSRATRQGTSKERITQSNLRPNLHLDVFSNAVNETLHDIAFREALADTMRLLNDNQIALALKKSLGEKHYKAITQRVSEIAIPQYNPTGMLEKAFSIARKNTVAVLLSGMTTALQNFTGIFPALTKVKAGLVAKNLIKFYSPAMTKNINFALESSPYIKSRLLNGYDRDVQGMIKEFTVNGRVLPDTKYALILMGLVDAGVSIPVWNAAFEQRMAETGNDTDASVKFADAVIQTTMGSGRDVDQSAMVSGKGAMNAFKQMFLMFFNYFQAQGQRLVVAGAISKQEWNSGNRANAVANFTVKYMFIVALPAIITEFLFGWGDDDDDEYMKRAIESTVFFQTAMVPLVRDVARPIWNQFDEDVKSFGYKMSPVESAIQMAIQTPGSVMDLMEGNGDDKDIKRAIMGVSFVTAMPGKLISDVTLGTKAFMEGDAGPQAIIVGPPKD